LKRSSIAAALDLASVGTSLAWARTPKTNASGNLIINDIQLEGINFDPVTGLLTATGGTVRGTLAGTQLAHGTEPTNITLKDIAHLVKQLTKEPGPLGLRSGDGPAALRKIPRVPTSPRDFGRSVPESGTARNRKRSITVHRSGIRFASESCGPQR